MHRVWLDFLYFHYEHTIARNTGWQVGKRLRGKSNRERTAGADWISTQDPGFGISQLSQRREEPEGRAGSERRKKGCGPVKREAPERKPPWKTKFPSFLLFPLLCYPQELTLSLKVQQEESSKQGDLGRQQKFLRPRKVRF